MRVRRDNKQHYILIGVIAGFLLLAGATFYFAKGYFDLRANPNKVAEEESKRLTEAVGKLYQLPTDETPILGKVQDKEKLKEQPFFANAQNGDAILIYQKAKVALIYREKDSKLINVGPIAIDAATQDASAVASVQIRKGTNNQAAVDDAKKTLDEIAGISIDENISDSPNKSRKQIIIVDVKGDKNELAQQIAQKLNGTVEQLPANETKSESDILVIVGG